MAGRWADLGAVVAGLGSVVLMVASSDLWPRVLCAASILWLLERAHAGRVGGDDEFDE